VLFSIIAMILSVVIVEAALRLTPINDLLGKTLKLGFTNEPTIIAGLLALGLFIGVIAGLYPALYLSSVPPMSALASTKGGKRGSFRLREFLVLVQFTVSVIVIACTIIMALQMRFISTKSLGFEKENRVIINMRGLDVIEKYQIIKNELLQNSNIVDVAACSGMIGTGRGLPLNAAMIDNKDGVQETAAITHIQVTDNFLDVLGIQLSSGRDFSKRFLTDVGTTFIANETMTKARGWKDPLGRRIALGQFNGRVIGIAKDFHFKSLHNSVEPFAMYQFNDSFQNIPADVRAAIQRVLIVQIRDSAVQQTLKFLQEKFSGYDPKHPFEYTFLDESIDALYLSEQRLMKMTGIFSGICIFISCLGLFGLASYITEQRKKEIGIRKVLGASASQIILMLARNILWLVLAGSIVASVVAYYAIDEWMTGFAYRTAVPAWAFLISAALVIVVAFLTIALQSYRTARTNPAVTLRYE
jgi:putative ABC transport system permease protein